MANAEEIAMSIMRQKARRKQELTFLAIAAIMVIACVVAWLHVDGVAATGEAMCGYNEHAHSAECYELVYLCGYEEGEVIGAEPDYAAIEADLRAQFEAEAAASLPATADEADPEAVTQDPSDPENTEPFEEPASTVPVVDEAALQEAIDAAFAEAEAAREVHTHSEDCVEARLVCEIEEHTHVPSCYSNANLDVETPLEWEATFADVELTGEWGKDVLAIAETQIGYCESEQNFQLGDDGERHGYTRYGDWYGNPYGVWDGLFVRFCLEYAQVNMDYLPCESGAYAWSAALQHASAYEPAADYLPQSGDIVFFNDDYEENEKADRVGIVKSVNEDLDELIVIEGDVNNAVVETPYALSSEAIQGYCDVEARQVLADNPGTGVTPIDEYVSGDEVTDEEEVANGVDGEDEADDSHEGDDVDAGADGDSSTTDKPEADGKDNQDAADENKEEDDDSKNDESQNSSIPPTDPKTDGEDSVTADKSEGNTAPVPSDESDDAKEEPIYASFVNADGEIIVIEMSAAQAVAVQEDKFPVDKGSEESSSQAGELEKPVAEGIQQVSKAATESADKDSLDDEIQGDNNQSISDQEVEIQDAHTENLNTSAKSEQNTAPDNAPEKPSVPSAASPSEESSNSEKADEEDVIQVAQPMDLIPYVISGSVEYQPAEQEAWTAVADDVILHKDDKVKFTLTYLLDAAVLSDDANSLACQVSGIKPLDPQKGDVLDEVTNAKLGTYSVTKEGLVTIVFNDASMQQNAEHAIQGSVSFECVASSITVDADQKATVGFGKMTPVVLTVAEESDEPASDEVDEEGKDGLEEEGQDKDDEPSDGDDNATASFSFVTVDGDTNEPLAGATFEVYEFDSAAGAYQLLDTLAPATSDSNGLVEIDQLKCNTAYYLQEIEAPVGYNLPENPIYFDVAEDKADQAASDETDEELNKEFNQNEAKGLEAATPTSSYPTDFAFSSEALVKQENGSYVLQNFLPKTAITVKVEWQSDMQTESVAIELWRIAKESKGEIVSNEQVPGKGAILQANSSQPWTTTFDNLPLQGPDGEGGVEAYAYYVVEPQSNLYKMISMVSDTKPIVNAPDGVVETTEDGGYKNVTGVTEGTIVITNEYLEPGYKLPASGGSGVLPYSITGGLIAVVAAMLVLVQRRSAGRLSERGRSLK